MPLGNLTFWISLSLSPKLGLSSKLSQEVKSIFSFGLELRTERRLSKSLSLKVGLSPKVNLNYSDLVRMNLHARDKLIP